MSESTPTTAEQTNAARTRELNDTIRYTMWSVFRLRDVLGDDADRAAEATDVEALVEVLAEQDVVVRGIYDVSGLRADADVMVWWHAADSQQLQGAYNAFRRTAFGRRLDPVWSQMALHRPAEFNKSHIPAFLADEEPRAHVCVYPFVRSYEWYLLDDGERRRMLAFEADELHRIVDLMRDLRASDARRHVREEVPFYTGARVTPKELLDRLP